MRLQELFEEYSQRDIESAMADGRTMKNPMPYISGNDPLFGKVNDAADSEVHFNKGNDFPEETVAMSNIVCTEPMLDPSNIKEPRNNELPVLIKYQGKYYVQDGNHRVVSAHLRGDTNIAAEIINIPETQTFTAYYDLHDVKGNDIDWGNKYDGGEVQVNGKDLDDIWPKMKELEGKRVQGKVPVIAKILDRNGEDVYN